MDSNRGDEELLYFTCGILKIEPVEFPNKWHKDIKKKRKERGHKICWSINRKNEDNVKWDDRCC